MSETSVDSRSRGSGRIAPRWFLAGLLVMGLISGCQWSASGYNAEGVRLLQSGQTAMAADRFQRALAEDPYNADALYNLGATYYRSAKASGRQEEMLHAEHFLRQSLERDPNHAECHRTLAVMLIERNRPEEAFQRLEDWARRNPRLPGPRIELARLYEEFGDKQIARERLLEAIALSPYDARARAALGRIQEQAGDYGQALSNYQMSLASDRFQPELQQRVASLQAAYGGRPMVGPDAGRVVTATPPTLR